MAVNTLMRKIFESPDGGRTVYERTVGSLRRDLISPWREAAREQDEWLAILETSREDTEMHELVERLRLLYGLRYYAND